jgi:carbon storage regulator
LVLTRRIGETTVIDGDIEVMVLSVSGGRVRLGIKAPPYIRVNRLEIEQELEALEVGAGRETRTAAQWQPPQK